MLGVSSAKGRLVITIAGMAYFMMLIFLKIDKGNIAPLITGAIMLLLSVYFKLVKKDLCLFFGFPTWIIGIVFIALAGVNYIN